MVRREFGVNVNLGAYAGASCVITNPEKLTAIIRDSDLLQGRDALKARLLKDFRKRQTLGAAGKLLHENSPASSPSTF